MTGALAIFWMTYCLISLLSHLANTPVRALGFFWLSIVVYYFLAPLFSQIYRGEAVERIRKHGNSRIVLPVDLRIQFSVSIRGG